MWGLKKASDLVDKLRGKTADEIQAELDAQAVQQAEFDRLKTVSTTLQAKDTELTTTKGELQQAKDRLALLEKPPVVPGAPKAPTSVFIDEDAAFAERSTPIVHATLLNSARLARMVAEEGIKSDPREAQILRKYYTEYEGLINQLSLPQQANEVSYKNVLDIIKGRHLHEITEMAAKNGGKYFTEDAGGAPPPTEKNNEVLSDLEKQAAKKLGITDEQYIKSRNSIEFINA